MTPAGCAEPLLAALPASWPEAGRSVLSLAALSGRPLFWFPRERNPAFFDFAKRIFALARFRPQYREEPAEHDVLLARIAAGEGMHLLPSSFAAIRREGVAFVSLEEAGLLRLTPGAAFGPECPEAARRVLERPRSVP